MVEINPELSEFMGIMVGDGNIYYSPAKRTYRFVITGHSKNDFSYLTEHVANLIFKLFGKKPSIWKYKKKMAIGLALYSRKIIDFLLSLGLKSGKKSQNAEIPAVILDGSKEIKARFLRGLADTDFCITFRNSRKRYPVIIGNTSSRTLACQIKELLMEFSITSSIYERKPWGFSKVKQYQISCYAMRNFNLWMENIGFSNVNHLSKILVWKLLGKYPTCSNLNERLIILNNSKNNQML